jgi:hypothetical protein
MIKVARGVFSVCDSNHNGKDFDRRFAVSGESMVAAFGLVCEVTHCEERHAR